MRRKYLLGRESQYLNLQGAGPEFTRPRASIRIRLSCLHQVKSHQIFFLMVCVSILSRSI